MEARAVGDPDGARDQLPVGLGQTAVGHGAVDDAVAAFTGLQQHSAGEEKWIGSGIDHGAAGAAHAERAGDVEEARGVHVKAHVAVRGFNVRHLRGRR